MFLTVKNFQNRLTVDKVIASSTPRVLKHDTPHPCTASRSLERVRGDRLRGLKQIRAGGRSNSYATAYGPSDISHLNLITVGI